MSKKVAIVTWYTNGNHGGTLQAYALQNVLTTLGHESEFVNYSPQKKSIKYRVDRFIKDLAIFFLKPKVGKTRREIFRFVKEKLTISNQYYSYENLIEDSESNYFAAICGSDQIWANVGDKIEEINYLTFIDKTKRIAYAPSTGYNRIDLSIEEEFISLVKDIRFLSVREKQGAQFIEKVTGCQAKVMVDPTLLLSKRQWEIEIQSSKIEKKVESDYIFAYFLGGNKEHAEYVYNLAEEKGLSVISIDTKNSVFKSDDKVIVDPLEFVELINNAQYVMTDSFHGVAFSINLEKQFVAFKRFNDDDPNNQNSRIYNILEIAELQGRLVEHNTSVNNIIEKNIDYSITSNLIEAKRKISLEYLKSSINQVLSEQN